jgi:hypothetical protein
MTTVTVFILFVILFGLVQPMREEFAGVAENRLTALLHS